MTLSLASIRRQLARSPFWAIVRLEAGLAWTPDSAGLVVCTGLPAISVMAGMEGLPPGLDTHQGGVMAVWIAMGLFIIAVGYRPGLPAILVLAVALSKCIPTPVIPASIWLLGTGLMALSPMIAWIWLGDRRLSSRKELCYERLLPVKRPRYHLAGAIGRVKTALVWTLEGCIAVASANWLASQQNLALPRLNGPFLWFVGGFWGWSLLIMGLVLWALLRSQTSPATFRQPIQRAWYAAGVGVAAVARVWRKGYDLTPLSLPEANWRRWVGRLLGRAAVLGLALGACLAVFPRSVACVGLVVTVPILFAVEISVALWPGVLELSFDKSERANPPVRFEALLPRRARRLWVSRLLAAAAIIGVATALPLVVARAVQCIGVPVTLSCDLSLVLLGAARIGLLSLLAWPLVPLLAMPVRHGRWVAFGGFYVGVMVSIPLVALMMAIVPVIGAAVSLAAAGLIAAVSRRLCDPNAWPIRRLPPLYEDVEVRGFFFSVLAGIAPGLIIYWAVAPL
jgi:hypothetical protein